MKLRDIREYYPSWNFCDKVPLVNKDEQWVSYFEEKFGNIDVDIDYDKFKEIVDTSVSENIQEVDEHIDNSKEEIIEKINTTSEDVKESLNTNIDSVKEQVSETEKELACKICCAKNDINKHIDEKIDPIQFEEKFSNLNEQVGEILKKLQ